jgi:hypothetical protein
MTKKLQDDFFVDALLEEAKRQEFEVPDALMLAILADADGLQAQPAKATSRDVRAPWWRGVVDQLGGWQAVSAFATCAAFGMYIGYASPTQVLSGFGTTISEAALEDGFSVASEFELSMLEG